jgi:prolyl 4-hydroxylase
MSQHRAMVETQAQSESEANTLLQQATLEAMGAGRPQNWERAFDLLEQAAHDGSTHARDQLRLLARNGGDNWAGLRASIDLPALLDVPQKISLSDRPRVRTMRGFATPDECNWVIRRLRDRLGPAMVWDSEHNVGKLDPARTSSAVELGVAEMDVVTELLRARISVATGLPEPIFESPQIMQYNVGQEFRPHYDHLDPDQPGNAADIARRGQRIATFIIFLNEDYDGGETEFPQIGIAHRGRTGDALFFANVTADRVPDPLTLHAGRPPTRGEKWIFSQWIRDRSRS